MHVPESNPTPAIAREDAREPEGPFEPAARDLALLDLPGRPPQPTVESPASVTAAGDAEPAATDATELDADTPVPWTDALLYPTNADGLIQIGIFAAGILGIRVLGPVLARVLQYYGTLVTPLLQVLLAGYILSIVGSCIFDSAKGGRRVPCVFTAGTPNMSDILSQLLLLVASIAVCFWPVGIYRALGGQYDTWFWMLAAGGAFFLPMAFLTASLFDGFDALNPFVIARSILVTFPAYLLLVVAIAVLALSAAALDWLLSRASMPRILSHVACLYLLMTISHLLGRFYWRRKDALQWGI